MTPSYYASDDGERYFPMEAGEPAEITLAYAEGSALDHGDSVYIVLGTEPDHDCADHEERGCPLDVEREWRFEVVIDGDDITVREVA